MRAVETADGELVGRAQAGDAAAYEELYRRHRDAVARAIYLLVREIDTAQDLAQEAFTVGWRDIARIRDPERFRGWVSGIGMNLARRTWRRRDIPAAEVVVPAPAPDVDLRLAVRSALLRLPMGMRAAVVLRFYVGLPEGEIAEALRIPLGTVKSRLSRARRRLAASLRAEVEHG